MKCSVIDCNLEGLEEHYITYIPEVKKPLCSEHHRKITIINSHQVRKQNSTYRFKGYYFREKKLSNKKRWAIWYKFINNQIKTRMSYLDKDYIKEGNLKYRLIKIDKLKISEKEKEVK